MKWRGARFFPLEDFQMLVSVLFFFSFGQIFFFFPPKRKKKGSPLTVRSGLAWIAERRIICQANNSAADEGEGG